MEFCQKYRFIHFLRYFQASRCIKEVRRTGGNPVLVAHESCLKFYLFHTKIKVVLETCQLTCWFSSFTLLPISDASYLQHREKKYKKKKKKGARWLLIVVYFKLLTMVNKYLFFLTLVKVKRFLLLAWITFNLVLMCYYSNKNFVFFFYFKKFQWGAWCGITGLLIAFWFKFPLYLVLSNSIIPCHAN